MSEWKWPTGWSKVVPDGRGKSVAYRTVDGTEADRIVVCRRRWWGRRDRRHLSLPAAQAGDVLVALLLPDEDAYRVEVASGAGLVDPAPPTPTDPTTAVFVEGP